MCAPNAIDDYDYIYEQPDDMMMKMSAVGAAVKSSRSRIPAFFIQSVYFMMIILIDEYEYKVLYFILHINHDGRICNENERDFHIIFHYSNPSRKNRKKIRVYSLT